VVKIIACKTTEIVLGQMKKITVAGKEIIISNVDGNYFAIDDTCTHSGASLSEGKLDGQIVTCDWHGAKFDCKNGKLVKFPGEIMDLKSYKIVIESENIFVDV
jgi:3-phenylpropionate/trans-cinnamate dioxygenase ferredoxin component